MLSINKVEYGFYPYAGAQGMQMFHYNFEVNDEKGETEEAVKNMFAFLTTEVEKLDKKDEFNASLLGQCYTVFTFNDLSKLFDDVNKDIWETFYANMSKMSFDAQKADAGGISSKMNAWPVALYTTPTFYSGKEEFYQYFNLLFCNLPIKETEDYSPFALTEILQNPFTHITCKCKTGKDVEDFVSAWLNKDEFQIPFSRVNILVDPENIKEVAPIVADLGLRLCVAFPDGIGLSL